VVIGIVLIAGHNLFDGVGAEALGAWGPLWSILHEPGIIVAMPGHIVFDAYPIVPWIGVTALGWALGATYEWPAERRHALLLRTGGAAIAAFLVLRGLNIYGDPSRWATQPVAAFTVLSFLNTTKYPPSMLFLLMTLGPALVLLRVAEAAPARWLEPARTIGKVPMFYFMIHFLLVHLIAVVVSAVRFGTIHSMFESPTLDHYPVTFPPGWGFALPAVYLVWIGVVLAMYPLCRWHAALKQHRRDWWLSYV
jgi:uncharacterized membrane protein